MDRRSWLWRRKSSDKSPGETESSGSISSNFERFSDDQACSNHHTQSPEVSSKAAFSDEELNEDVKTVTEKLSAALLNIKAKEDLVNQHAKVAEEAVTGWEKAESDVLALKQLLEGATQKNSVLEDRVGHLDGALKECLRQLRQAREEQEQKIHEALMKRSCEWDIVKSELETQLVELQSQLEASKNKALTSTDPGLCPKLDAAEKENLALKLELLSHAKELEIRTIERDLSTKAAETASKQHLESIKKVTKLEAECRRLKAMARKALPGNDYRSATASTIYVESCADSQSDSGERLMVVENSSYVKMGGLEPNECELSHPDSWPSALTTELNQFKHEKALGRNLMAPSVEIYLMDDFLEMERLAALPETESGSCCPDLAALSDQPHGGESPLKAELEAMINRTAELEEKLEKMEMEKVELEMALTQCRDQLKASKEELMEEKVMLVELQTQLSLVNEAKSASVAEFEAIDTKRKLAESQLVVVESETKALVSKVGHLEEELQKERALTVQAVGKCRKMEDELLRMKREAEIRNASLNADLKIKQETELAVAATKFAECQKTIASLGRQLKSLATFEDFLMDSEKLLELPKEEEGSQFPQDSSKTQKLHPNDLCLPEKETEAVKRVIKVTGPIYNGSEGDRSQPVAAEKSRNGTAKLFPRSNSKKRTENK